MPYTAIAVGPISLDKRLKNVGLVLKLLWSLGVPTVLVNGSHSSGDGSSDMESLMENGEFDWTLYESNQQAMAW